MTIIKLIRDEKYFSYDTLSAIPPQSNLLSMFLTDDVGRRVSRYIQEFDDTKDYAGAMNATQYTKINDMVTITPEWVMDEQISIEQGNFFTIKAHCPCRAITSMGKRIFSTAAL